MRTVHWDSFSEWEIGSTGNRRSRHYDLSVLIVSDIFIIVDGMSIQDTIDTF